MNEASLGLICQEIAGQLLEAGRVLFITGAGVSADSGLPTYRGVSGLYNDETTEDGLSIEEAMSGGCFAEHPEITWKYLAQIERNCEGVKPNAAHHVIAELEKRVEVVVLTQNVDGLHTAAGSTNVIEINGTLRERFCPQCGAPARADDREVPPRCNACGGIVRPKVVLFNETLPEEALQRFNEECARGFGMVFIIGTSAVFPYIVEPVIQALDAGVMTVEINPAITQLSNHVDCHIPLGAADSLACLYEAVFGDEE